MYSTPLPAWISSTSSLVGTCLTAELAASDRFRKATSYRYFFGSVPKPLGAPSTTTRIWLWL
jgi:hypothetical protein